MNIYESYAVYAVAPHLNTDYKSLQMLIVNDLALLVRFGTAKPSKKVQSHFERDMANTLQTLVYVKFDGTDLTSKTSNNEIKTRVKSSLAGNFIQNTYRLLNYNKIITIGLNEFHALEY